MYYWLLCSTRGVYKVQLHVPVVHPGQRPKLGDHQSGWSTVGEASFLRVATVTVKAWLEPWNGAANGALAKIRRLTPYVVDTLGYWNRNYEKLCRVSITSRDWAGIVKPEFWLQGKNENEAKPVDEAVLSENQNLYRTMECEDGLIINKLNAYKVVLNFKSEDETLVGDHSNRSYWAVLSCLDVYFLIWDFISDLTQKFNECANLD